MLPPQVFGCASRAGSRDKVPLHVFIGMVHYGRPTSLFKRAHQAQAAGSQCCSAPAEQRVSEIAVNATLAMIESEQPRGETECAIVIQMACLHSATMAVLGRLGGANGGDRNVVAAATAASRLSRSFAILVETLRRLRSGGSQVIRIERVEVKEGGQAVIGNIQKTGGSQATKTVRHWR